MSDDDIIPAAPNPQITTLVAAVLRHVLAAAGAMGVLGGATVSDSNLMVAAGLIAWLISVGWSVWQKWSAAQAQHQAAILSARKRTPVQTAAVPTPPWTSSSS